MVLQLRQATAKELAELSSAESYAQFIAPDDYDALPENALVDLDKSWHAIHFLLTGEAGPAALPAGALLAGKDVGEDNGYGPARLLDAADVSAFAAFLSLKPDDFVERTFDFEALQNADIYPTIWDRRDAEDVKYVSHYFQLLRAFISDAAASGNAIIAALL